MFTVFLTHKNLYRVITERFRWIKINADFLPCLGALNKFSPEPFHENLDPPKFGATLRTLSLFSLSCVSMIAL